MGLIGGFSHYACINGNPLMGQDPLGYINPTKLLACIANAGCLYASGGLKFAAAAGLEGMGVAAPIGLGVAAMGDGMFIQSALAESVVLGNARKH
jgi:type VI secretion system secreted protein VgrG